MKTASLVAWLAGSAVAGVLAGGAQVSQSAAPDLILVGGRVYTLDPARPWADAVAVHGDRIVGVGTSAEMRQAAGASTRVIDLNGGFVTPGFNDGHVHVEATGALLTGANLLDVHEPKAFRERIAQAASRLPAGSWITRGDWGAYEKWGRGVRAQHPSPRAHPPPRALPPPRARPPVRSCRIES